MKTIDLDLKLIVRDMELQPRAEMDKHRIVQYAEDMLAGIEFPPVIVYFDGEDYWLSEGFHRCAAASEAELESIPAEVREGTRDDALLNSAASNREWDINVAGMKRTNADKRRAVDMVLKTRPGWTNKQVAKWVSVDDSWIARCKKERAERGTLIRDVLSDSPTGNTLYVPPAITNGNGYGMTRERLPGQSIFPMFADEPQIGPLEASIATEVRPAAKPTFNVTNEMVDWARWTWNPVTGCEHTCAYCYARDIANRFYPEKFAPTFRPERLYAPVHTALPMAASYEQDPIQRTAWRNCFVCSMADLFGRWVPEEWIKAVFRSCSESPQWNYLFLTKFPQRYPGLDFPETSWVGTTVDEQKRVVSAEKAFRKIEVPVKWLSVEPMLEPIKFSDLRMFDWVVIGGQSRNSECPEFFPDPRWVLDLTDQAIASGCKVYWKENVSPRKGLFKEYPAAFTE